MHCSFHGAFMINSFMKLMKNHFPCYTNMLREDHMHKDLLAGHVADFICCSDEAYFRGKKNKHKRNVSGKGAVNICRWVVIFQYRCTGTKPSIRYKCKYWDSDLAPLNLNCISLRWNIIRVISYIIFNIFKCLHCFCCYFCFVCFSFLHLVEHSSC